MSLLKAVSESNAAKKGSEGKDIFDGKDEGAPEKVGYVMFGFPKTGPAEGNSDVSDTKGSNESAQEGTGLDAYKHQSEKVSPESGD